MIEWKDIVEYEGLYSVSNTGEVLNVRSGRRLKPILNKVTNYLKVSLSKEGKVKVHSIHRLVGLHFLPNPDNLPNVCHKDDIRSNNHIDNLFWGTQKDNIEDALSKGRMKGPIKHGQSQTLDYHRKYNKRYRDKKKGLVVWE